MADGRKSEKIAIKVTVHYPEKLSESIRQTKIERLYDILKPRSDENKEGTNSANSANNDDYGEHNNDKKTA